MLPTQPNTANARHPRRTPRHRGRVGLSVAAMAATVPAAAALNPAPATATFAGDNGRIAYTHLGNIFTARADGTDKVQLTRGHNAVGRPAWSPDGHRIAFTKLDLDTGLGDIWVMKATGRGKTRLLGGRLDDKHPTWSPDGRHLALVHEGQLATYSFSTSSLRRLTSAQGRWTTVDSPTWSPDGSRIAFGRLGRSRNPDLRRHEMSRLFTIRPDGTALRPLTTGTADWAPDWSPDGDRVVFTRGGLHLVYSSAVLTVRADGQDPHTVIDTPSADMSPSWSPDGHRIILQSHGPRWPDESRSGLWKVAPDGTHRRFVLPGGNAPTWQPLPPTTAAEMWSTS